MLPSRGPTRRLQRGRCPWAFALAPLARPLRQGDLAAVPAEVKVPAGSFPTSQDRFTTYGFKATQVLYDFGKTSSSISSAKYGLKAARSNLPDPNRAALEFIVSYFDLLEAEELLKVAQEEVTRYEAHRKDACRPPQGRRGHPQRSAPGRRPAGSRSSAC